MTSLLLSLQLPKTNTNTHNHSVSNVDQFERAVVSSSAAVLRSNKYVHRWPEIKINFRAYSIYVNGLQKYSDVDAKQD